MLLFFSEGLVGLRSKPECRFHGNYITDKKLQKAFVNINIWYFCFNEGPVTYLALCCHGSLLK